MVKHWNVESGANNTDLVGFGMFAEHPIFVGCQLEIDRVSRDALYLDFVFFRTMANLQVPPEVLLLYTLYHVIEEFVMFRDGIDSSSFH
ncbi:hypothetical protein NY65_20640 [Xanthomonas phaseoli pv. phaseoli]|nr:hypothetical protein NY65_20640 [Xanthomonas phaseoli pv. phaseoli]KGP22269.1 hypothetical protein NY68_20015 [Xanthomonas citri pv. fuscans]KGP23499.1 hypothetical protein NY67_17565 [Xanthomonas citri pv. fuscans]KGP33667.1 hypothetical protein NY64_19595 [Xanthomonas citri pv. fuscans]